MDEKNIHTELRELSPLLSEKLPWETGFSLPKGYFEKLTDRVMDTCADAFDAKEETTLLTDALQGIGKTSGFKTPEGYFGSLTDRLMETCEQEPDVKEELAEISPFLSGVLNKEKTSKKLPEGYFDSFADKVIPKEEAKQETVQEAKIVGMGTKRRGLRRVFAGAASVALLVVAGLFIMNQNGGTDNPFAHLEELDQTEVLAFLDNNFDDVDFDALLETGVMNASEIDFADPSDLSDEETDYYLSTLSEEDEEIF